MKIEKSPNSNKVGAVMVVGGGICGMQSALDLASSGFKVYLVEETTSIGGRMAQLDKTFPTNDCSMCMISPKLIEVGRHPNIEIVTNAEVLSLDGEEGNFMAQVRKRPRFIDLTKCSSCGDCVEVCPVIISSEFEEELATRKAIFKRYPQAIPSAMSIDKRGTSPCKIACPAHISVQGYVALIYQGKFKEALDLIREQNPLPGICGRVCVHPCETDCSRTKVDEAVSICQLKRYVADEVKAGGEDTLPAGLPKNGRKVAIVGSGPAGLSAAYFLALSGYEPTIFEANPVLGGMMSVGIPEYRLPRDVVKYEIDRILQMGVEVKLNTRVGSDVTVDQLSEQYEAVFVGVGAPQSRRLGLEGIDLDGVLFGVDFLRDAASGKMAADSFSRKKVVVVGGGNVAIDVARSSLRLGASEVHVVCLESRQEMPSHEWEIEAAIEEGVELHCSLGPKRVLGGKGNVTGLECVACTRVFDADGRFNPEFASDITSSLDADVVIIAIGQQSDLTPWREAGITTTPQGTVNVDPVTVATNKPGIFAGGDCVSGPASVIQAIAAGKEAAISIDRYLKGEDIALDRERTFTPVEVPLEGVKKMPRHNAPHLPVAERRRDFREVELELSHEAAKAEAERCLACGLCSECYQCVAACQANAIDHTMLEQTVDLNVGSVILAPGFEEFDAALKDEYGYGRMPNVINSMQFERILSASGPYQGQVLRPSDGKHAVKIAWIQCVGSRDETCDRDYCSSVCCMYATKEAIIAREHAADIEPTIFYNDMRAYGKGFERYFESAKDKFGIRYVRGLVSGVKELQQSHNLVMEYDTDEGRRSEEFDMVVLSIGLVPSASTKKLAERLAVDVDQFGFCRTEEFEPNVTSRPGVYVAGAFNAPMDIPESVMNASGAAHLASQGIAQVRGSMVTEKAYPPELSIDGQEPRIGVFVCRCGSNIARVVDVPGVAEYAKTLPYVVHADENLYTCSTDTQIKIVEAIKEKNLNRVVVASCSPRTHEPLFQDTIQEAGLNKFLFEMANIRDQCSWVHSHFPDRATEKSKDLVRMAVARAATLKPLHQSRASIHRSGLVIGGGAAGMTAALGLAAQGFDAVLVEREKELGGNLKNLHYTLDGSDPHELLKSLVAEVEREPRIQVYKESTVQDFSGYVGNYVSRIATAGGELHDIEHGVVILATGGVEFRPSEYSADRSDKVITQLDLEDKLVRKAIDLKDLNSVVMIQCVGSREKDNMYCSRVCCGQAIGNALKIKEDNAKAEVYILYRDIRTYGMKELKYREARDKGVTFIRFEDDMKPEVDASGDRVMVSVYDSVLGRSISLPSDLVVLSAAVRPQPDAHVFASKLKLPLTQDGFYMEAHMKLRPLDFINEGMYLCGMAHAPKTIAESIAQAKGAVSRAATILAQPYLMVGGIVSVVDQDRCVACLTCVRSCPFNVPTINADGFADIEQAACRGCGICTSACPRKAIRLQHYDDEQILAKTCVLYV